MSPIIRRLRAAFLVVSMAFSLSASLPASAITNKDFQAIVNGTPFYDETDYAAPADTSGGMGLPPGAGTAPGNPTGNIAIGKEMAAARGFTGAEFDCLYNLWQGESGWNERADNPNSSAYGIPQSLPGSKMAANGADWATNPRTQIAWGLDYITQRYKTPCNAYNIWLGRSPHWY